MTGQPTPPQRVRLTSLITGDTVLTLLGENPPVFAADGGWEVVPRPRRKGFLEWKGQAPYTMQLEIVVDGFVADRDVSTDVERIRRMWRVPVGPNKEPGPVAVFGAVNPLQHLPWVIDNMDRVKDERNRAGVLVRAFVTLTLIEYVAGDILVSARPSPAEAAQERANVDPSAAPRAYTVRAGDTLSGIAARELGDMNRWPEIADLNGVRDPRALAIGQELRLP